MTTFEFIMAKRNKVRNLKTSDLKVANGEMLGESYRGKQEFRMNNSIISNLNQEKNENPDHQDFQQNQDNEIQPCPENPEAFSARVIVQRTLTNNETNINNPLTNIFEEEEGEGDNLNSPLKSGQKSQKEKSYENEEELKRVQIEGSKPEPELVEDVRKLSPNNPVIMGQTETRKFSESVGKEHMEDFVIDCIKNVDGGFNNLASLKLKREFNPSARSMAGANSPSVLTRSPSVSLQKEEFNSEDRFFHKSDGPWNRESKLEEDEKALQSHLDEVEFHKDNMDSKKATPK